MLLCGEKLYKWDICHTYSRKRVKHVWSVLSNYLKQNIILTRVILGTPCQNYFSAHTHTHRYIKVIAKFYHLQLGVNAIRILETIDKNIIDILKQGLYFYREVFDSFLLNVES